MPNVTDAIDRLYSLFILRDILAKVVPGFLLLATVALDCPPAARMLRQLVGASPAAITWPTLYALSFMTGMLLQFVGMNARLVPIHVWRRVGSVTSERRSLLIGHWYTQREIAYDASFRIRERFAILKEMSGNFGCLALLSAVSGLAKSVFSIGPRHPSIFLPIVLATVGALLIWESHYHASEQRIWEQGELELPSIPPDPDPQVHDQNL
jgi:hypothetical protein